MAQYQDTDLDLIRLALRGRRQAQTLLVQRLNPVICAHVRRVFGARALSFKSEDGRDLVQRVWQRLWEDEGRRLRAFDPEQASLEHYVGFIARRVAQERLRVSGEERAVDAQATPQQAEGVPASSPSPESAAVGRVAAEQLFAHLLATLPERGGLVLKLVYADGLAPVEAAQALGVNRQVIDNWLHRIRKEARAFLSTRSDPPAPATPAGLTA